MRYPGVLAACVALAACDGSGEGNQSAEGGNKAAATATVAAAKDGEAPNRRSLLDTLGGDAQHASLARAVKTAGLEKTLSGAQPYTLFAPTEAAFAKLPGGSVDGLLAPDQKGRLTALLTGHIVPGTVTAEDLTRAVERGKGKAQLATVGGVNLTLARQGETLVVSDAKGGQARVVAADRAASNGVIHGIDGLLLPE